MMTNKISINDLHTSFGQKKVLEGINLNVPKGESLVILGGSGSGKSVLIKNIIGIIKPDKGSIKIDDKEITQLSRTDYDNFVQKFGFLFQGGALFDSLKIWENISFIHLNNLGTSPKDALLHAIKKLEQVGLSADVAHLYPSQLSGGMQKRASLARAISLDPEILFFDEPTTGLDPIMSGIINELIVETSKKIGATTITITHDIHSAKIIADKVAMLYEGKIIWHDVISKLSDSNNPYVSQFINGLTKGPIKIKLEDH